jgi:hypothetical protein
MIAAKLDAALRSVCPIDGVSIGRKDDKATWRIDFKDEATSEQRTAAQAVLDAFDPDYVDPRIAIKQQLSDIDKATGSVRWVRELALGFAELHSILVSNGTQLPSLGSGMAKVQAIEDQCKSLRQQLSQL